MLIATYQEAHVRFDWQSCNLISERNVLLIKVLGPRKAINYQILFRAGARESLAQDDLPEYTYIFIASI